MLMENQTISAPHMHAKAIEYMESVLTPGNHILDIGSGSGYLCAVFGEAVGVRIIIKNKRESHRDRGCSSLVDYSNNIIEKHYPELMKYRE